jgi:hypothetical protein
MDRIQVFAIVASLCFLASVLLQIKRGKLREEYALVWTLSTVILILLSFWRGALRSLAEIFGAYEPLNLIFAGAIFAVLIYLLHLSTTVSKLQLQIRLLAQEVVLLKEKQLKVNQKQAVAKTAIDTVRDSATV